MGPSMAACKTKHITHTQMLAYPLTRRAPPTPSQLSTPHFVPPNRATRLPRVGPLIGWIGAASHHQRPSCRDSGFWLPSDPRSLTRLGQATQWKISPSPASRSRPTATFQPERSHSCTRDGNRQPPLDTNTSTPFRLSEASGTGGIGGIGGIGGTHMTSRPVSPSFFFFFFFFFFWYVLCVSWSSQSSMDTQ
jgi:hypothetical protein